MSALNTIAFEKAMASFKRSIVVSTLYLQDPMTPIDLKETLQAGVLALLDAELAESDLSYKVDLVDWSRIDESFKSIIRDCYEVL